MTTTTTTRGCGPLSQRYDDALRFAADVHRTQPRKGSAVPYLSHVMTVSALVLEDNGSEREAIAALLHDALEDGPAGTRERLLEQFGQEVLDLVQACTDDEPEGGAKRPWTERKVGYVAHLADAPAGALRITAADKLHNLRSTLTDLLVGDGWPPSNACLHQSLWYYASVEDAVVRGLPGSRIAAELTRTLAAVAAVLDVPLPTPTPEPPVCTECPR